MACMIYREHLHGYIAQNFIILPLLRKKDSATWVYSTKFGYPALAKIHLRHFPVSHGYIQKFYYSLPLPSQNNG